MSSARLHARNLAANWLGHGATIAVLFFLSPYIVHTLGKVEYGLWSLLTVLTGYMGLMDLGIRASTGRFIVLYLAKEDEKAVDETIRTALGFYSALGLFVVALGAVLGWMFPALFRSVPEEYHLIAQLLLPLLALNVLLSALQGVFASVLAAHERFDLARSVDITVLVLRAVATVTALWWGYRITALAVVSLGGHAAALAGSYVLARHVYRPLRVWPMSCTKVRLRELFGYGLAAFVSRISYQIMGQTDLIIAGAAIGVSATAVYSVGAMLVFYSGRFLEHIGATLFPALQRAVAREEAGDTRWLFLRTGRLWLVFGLLAYVGMIVFAEPFIRLWMLGPQFDEASIRQAALVMQILAGSKLLFLFKGQSGSVLNAMGRVRLTAATVAVEAVLNLALSLLFVLGFGWGLAGIAGGTLAARLLAGTFIVPWYACAAARIPWRRYLLEVGGLGLAAGSLFALVCLGVRAMLPGGTWPLFFGQVGLATALYGALAYALLIPPADRRRLRLYFFGSSTASEAR
jgi:O-antigen/teichoic acid export membrane protein